MAKTGKIKWIIPATIFATLVTGIAPAAADPSSVPAPSRAVTEDRGFDSRVADASDADLMTLLITGTGPIAAAHPELPRELGFNADPMPVDAEGLNLVVETFIAKYPNYTSLWAPAIKSGDPVKIDKGLSGFMADFVEFVQSDEVFSQYRDAAATAETSSGPRLYAAKSSGVVAVWNVVIAVNAAVAATTFVAAATVAAGAMAIVLVAGVFIAYLDDVESGNAPMDMNNIREGLVDSLAS